jgi:hypothetical protein
MQNGHGARLLCMFHTIHTNSAQHGLSRVGRAISRALPFFTLQCTLLKQKMPHVMCALRLIPCAGTSAIVPDLLTLQPQQAVIGLG